MALTAKFQADFSSFYKAVQDATAKLEGFQQEADQVSKSLDRMVDTLSGKRLISNATLMVKAVEEIGGASKLTDAELRKVSATVGEAAAKMQKMGITVPQGFKDIQTAAEGVKAPTEGWGSTLTNVTNIVRGFLALQIVGWFKDAAAAGFQWSSAMAKMHSQTDLTFRDLQVLEDVAINTGTSIETLAKGVQILQKTIGDRTARKGIQELGVSFDALLRMKPADQFATIASALAKIEDPTARAAAAAKIFGNTYREIMPALRADMKEIAANTKVVADSQIEAADRASARWDKFWNDQKKGWASWAGSVVEGVDKGMQSWEEANKKGAEARAKLFGGAGALPNLPAAPTLPIAGGATVNDVIDPTMISQLEIYGQTLDQTVAAHARLTAAEQVTTRTRNEFTAMSRVAAGAEFEWQNQINLTKFKTDQLTVSESQLYVATATLASFVASHKGEMFPEPPPGSLDAWKTAQRTITELPPQISTLAKFNDGLSKSMAGVESILSGINEKWAQVATVGSRAIQDITANLKRGDWVGAIVAATAALVPFIAHLFGASEESKKVSPMRDEFFRLQGGLERLNPRVQELEGNLDAVQAVFNAKTVQAYDAAISNLNRILDQDQKALDQATDAADDYAATLKKIPSKIPVVINYSETGSKPAKGSVPGFATGTDGFQDFGSGTLAMLHGREAVVPESAVANVGGGGGGALGGSVVININAQGAFFDTPGDLQRLADKVNDALTAKYGLTNRNRAA